MENRANILRAMQICRFCLSQEGPLSNIYERQPQKDKQTVPLPLQLMACVAIEVFENDGMPQLICKTCRAQTQQAYTFKTNCKKADDALKVFLATGNLNRPWTQEEITQQAKAFQSVKRAVDKIQETPRSSKKPKVEVSPVVAVQETVPESEPASPPPPPEEAPGEEPAETILNSTLKVNQVKTDCFPCPKCERSFPLKQLLDLHVANHSRERNFMCGECDKAFFTKYDLNKHQLTHSDSRPFRCVICGKAFARESLLHRHEKIHIDAPKYLCSQCDRTFLTEEDYDAHNAKHKKQRPFTCKICQKSFVFKQGLERHAISHSTIKPHKCNYCEASFTSAIKLTRHVTSHAGLRPYPCKLCGRTFLLSHHLTRHMRSHYAAQNAAEAPYLPPIGQHKCDICSMSFRRKDSLINHSAIHSMVNLKCVICNTEFDNVVKVKEHITTHLADLPFPCEKCDYSFETQEQLEDHELKHAEMEYEEQIEQEVLAEARQSHEEDEDEEEEYSGDDIAEFTITNDMENPEVVRRSKRSPKIKNYAEFLKDELGSDLEEASTANPEEQAEEIEMNSSSSSSQHQQAEDGEESTIKPIIRTEGTKVYARKSLNPAEKPKFSTSTPITLNDQIGSLSNPHTLKDINKLPDKEVFNMKIGDKTVTVQKLLLTKEQMKAMAREGKLEKKGNTLLLKKGGGGGGQSFQTVSLDSILKEERGVKRTYQRKMSASGGDGQEQNLPTEDNE